METNHGFKIKDLRIIKNRGLENIILVDNLVHSFGLQINNGIPILEFTNDEHDKELKGLENFLIEIKDADDVRVAIEEKLQLKAMLQLTEK